MVRTILVEDDADLRALLSEELQSEGLEVEAVGSAIALYQTLLEQTFDVAVLDVGLPDQSGFEITQYLREKTSTGIIILSARGSKHDRISGYNAGADAYFIKPVDGVELALAIKNLAHRLGGESVPDLSDDPDPSCWVLDQTRWCLISPNKQEMELSTKEFQFLERLMVLDKEPVKRADLIAALAYARDESGEHALESLVTRLRKKLASLTDGGSPIKTAWGLGYKFAAPCITRKSNRTSLSGE
uniref:Putative transcriptional regulatory protein SrrA [srrA] n=1 Tax=Magnetococcus massalia (strain MO-1) TaxID=451514 RepID=A0A1S7LE19_MAGMO|nr:Putative transcriptional regulatory protein SrrA [srrA] [Candidatus Magnetococcus massalia]